MRYKIKIDKNKCIGCGSCATICPGSFELRGDKAVVKKAEFDTIDSERDAEAICPVQAISII